MRDLDERVQQTREANQPLSPAPRQNAHRRSAVALTCRGKPIFVTNEPVAPKVAELLRGWGSEGTLHPAARAWKWGGP